MMTVKETHAPSITLAVPERQVPLAFVLFVILIGGASVAIRVTYQELAPFWMATARFGLGALTFWIIAFINILDHRIY